MGRVRWGKPVSGTSWKTNCLLGSVHFKTNLRGVPRGQSEGFRVHLLHFHTWILCERAQHRTPTVPIPLLCSLGPPGPEGGSPEPGKRAGAWKFSSFQGDLHLDGPSCPNCPGTTWNWLCYRQGLPLAVPRRALRERGPLPAGSRCSRGCCPEWGTRAPCWPCWKTTFPPGIRENKVCVVLFVFIEKSSLLAGPERPRRCNISGLPRRERCLSLFLICRV